MPFVYKVNVLEKLKEKGYSSYKLRKEQLIGQGALQKIREGGMPSWHELDLICTWLGCQPGELIQHKPDPEAGPDLGDQKGQTKQASFNYLSDYGPSQQPIYHEGDRATEMGLRLGVITEADVTDPTGG